MPRPTFAVQLMLCAATVALMVTGAGSALSQTTAGQITVNSRHFTSSDGVRLHVLEAGPAAPSARAAERSPVVAFIPGWSMPAEVWRRQLEAIGQHYRVAALDPRGQGRSEVASTGYTAERRAADIDEFLKPYSRVLLVGWSLGALETLYYVHRFGEGKLAGIVLVDSSVGENPRGPATDFLDRLKHDREATLDEFVHAIFRAPRAETEIRELVAGAMNLPLEASIELLSWAVPRNQWRKITRGIRAPLLYAVTPQFAQQAANLRKHRSRTQVAVFEQAGHALFADEPERFNTLLENFIKKTRK